MFCLKCGAKCPDGAAFCHSCGQKLPSAGNVSQSNVPPAAYNNAVTPQNVIYYVKAPVPGKGQAITSMILGIFSVLCPTLIIPIIGLIFARAAKNRGYYGGMRTAGFVLCLISILSIPLVILIILAACGVFSYY